MNPALTPAQRKALKARAHHLDPVVMIGDAGLSDAVLLEAERALSSHGLIKLRVLGDDRARRREILHVLCETLGCSAVQIIGKVLVVWRALPEEQPVTGDEKPREGKTLIGKKRLAQGRPAPKKTVRKALKTAAKRSRENATKDWSSKAGPPRVGRSAGVAAAPKPYGRSAARPATGQGGRFADKSRREDVRRDSTRSEYDLPGEPANPRTPAKTPTRSPARASPPARSQAPAERARKAPGEGAARKPGIRGLVSVTTGGGSKGAKAPKRRTHS